MTTDNFDLDAERTVLAYALFAKNQPGLGLVQPVAELINNKLCAINRDNFCNTMRVFITSHYEELEKSFPAPKLFQLRIRLSVKSNENVSAEMACKYVATATDASPIKPKDYFEIVKASLPDAHSRVLSLDAIPGTQYIFLDDDSWMYGPFQWSKLSQENSTAIALEFLDAPLPNVSLAPYQTYKYTFVRINVSPNCEARHVKHRKPNLHTM